MPTIRSYSGEIAAKLQDYQSRGRKEGSKSRPPSNAAAPDQHESELKSLAEGWLSAEQAIFDATLTDVSKTVTESRQKARDLETAYGQLLQDDTASSTVEAELAGMKPAVVQATEARMLAEQDIKYFRAENNIHEQAVYPDSKLWHFGWLAILAVIEVVVNAFFFENSEGLLGGVIVALGIAAVNMSLALGLGILFRHQNLAALGHKILGWSAVVAFLLVAIFCNALFASFRSEYQAVVDPTEAAQIGEAFRRAWPEAVLIFRANMEFKDHWSFILFGVGMVLSIWAFWKGYTIDDKYPGYGAKDRVYKAAVAAEQLEEDKVRQKIKDLLHQKKAAVNAAVREPATQVGMLSRRVADLTHARDLMDTRVNAVRRDFTMVTQAYRHANASIRSIQPPAYFQDPSVLTTSVSTDAAQAVLADLQAVEADLKATADINRDALNTKLNDLQVTQTTFLTSGMAVFMSEVHQEAEDRINRRTRTVHQVQVA